MIKEQKIAVRKQVNKLKRALSDSDLHHQSDAIFAMVEDLKYFQEAQVVMLYWSMNDEVATHCFIEKWWREKTILLPVVEGSVLRIKQYLGKQCMVEGQLFGILEPTGNDFENLNAIDVIIVPGVAFDKNNNRMGRGRGYYDKLLDTTQAYKIGVCFNFQFFENIPVEAHDLAMDLVVKGRNC